MSPGPRNSAAEPWRPTARLDALRRRAVLLAAIRRFFAERRVLEVETPLLGAATATDPHLASIGCTVATGGGRRTCYLQTSPEHAMKRLLAAGSGPIFQLGRAFRDGESGRLHNPEFTLLEWYRPGWDHQALMGEVEELLAEVLGTGSAERLTYRELFLQRLGIDPLEATAGELAAVARRRGIDVRGLAEDADPDPWLHLLLAQLLEPGLGRGRPTFVYDFPPSQAALARIRPGEPPVAERFEVYVEGVELANGFHELTDAAEQRRRFAADNAARRARGLPELPLDERLLAALAAGLPPCAGVALGVDRLAMLAVGARALSAVVVFPIERA